jgi:hypothetical protein
VRDFLSGAYTVAPGFMSTPMSIIDGVNDPETPEFIEWYVKKGKIPLRRRGCGLRRLSPTFDFAL